MLHKSDISGTENRSARWAIFLELCQKNKQKMGADFNALKKETDSHMKQPEATLDGRKGHI